MIGATFVSSNQWFLWWRRSPIFRYSRRLVVSTEAGLGWSPLCVIEFKISIFRLVAGCWVMKGMTAYWQVSESYKKQRHLCLSVTSLTSPESGDRIVFIFQLSCGGRCWAAGEPPDNPSTPPPPPCKRYLGWIWWKMLTLDWIKKNFFLHTEKLYFGSLNIFE